MNYGKDFSRDTIELIARGDPGSYVTTSGADHELYRRGAATFLTEQDVRNTYLKSNENNIETILKEIIWLPTKPINKSILHRQKWQHISLINLNSVEWTRG